MAALKPIRTETEYYRALARIEQLWDAESGTVRGDELEVLVILVEAYEKEAHPIPPPHPIDALLFTMEQRGMKAKDLAPMLGTTGRVSEILRRKRPLTLGMIRSLHASLGLNADVLIKEYRLGKTHKAARPKKAGKSRKPGHRRRRSSG